MFKYQSISVYGFLIILSGVSLLIKSGSDIKIHALVLSLTLILSSIIAGVAALKTLTNKVQSRYHTLHAVGLLFYGCVWFLLVLIGFV
jgi:hypothetical protein